MLTLLIGGILLVVIGVFVAWKTNKDRFLFSIGLGGLFVLLILLLFTHRGSLGSPDYDYQAAVNNNGQEMSIYFDDFKQSDEYVIIDDYKYYDYEAWTWVLQRIYAGAITNGY